MNQLFKPRRHKFGAATFFAMMLFGAIFTAIGYEIYKSWRIDDTWVRVQGKVVDTAIKRGDSTTYAAVVEYSVAGATYRVTSQTSSSISPSIGNPKEVAYNPTNPGTSKVIDSSGMKFLGLSFPAIGILSLVLSPLFFIKSLKRTSAIRRLKKTGQKITGIIAEIQTVGKSSGRQVYKLVAVANGPAGTPEHYLSDKVSGIIAINPDDLHNNPVAIDVYINLLNPQDYYVDIDDIPGLTAQNVQRLVQRAQQAAGTPKDQV